MRPLTLSWRSWERALEAKRPITIEKIEMKVRKIKTVPVRLTNLTPKRFITAIIPSIRKLKNLIENAIGPRLNPVTTCMASIAPNIDIADENVVAR